MWTVLESPVGDLRIIEGGADNIIVRSVKPPSEATTEIRGPVPYGLTRTDYAVLVMARIKERHDAGDSNEEAVAVGIARTGRVITAAALAIALVFLAFAVSSVFFVKQIAIGMAVGVLIDATIVRALLVPSLMRLLGEWNWWAPRPLARLHRRIGLQESPA